MLLELYIIKDNLPNISGCPFLWFHRHHKAPSTWAPGIGSCSEAGTILRWAVFKIPLSFHLILVGLWGWPYWIIIIPNILGSIILYNHQPTRVLNTARVDKPWFLKCWLVQLSRLNKASGEATWSQKPKQASFHQHESSFLDLEPRFNYELSWIT